MQVAVQILSMCKYTSKKDNKQRVRIDYIVNEDSYLNDKDNFRGYAVLTIYLDNVDNWNNLNASLVGKAVEFKFEKQPSTYDPTKERTVLKEIITKNGNISIL